MPAGDRNQKARQAAENALVRVAHHYGSEPDFVVIGGLVPGIICAAAPVVHQGTTDIDVQVNLEIQAGGRSAARLEQALRNSDFRPVRTTAKASPAWRWEASVERQPVVVKLELLADLDDQPAQSVIGFEDATDLGAINLRGTARGLADARPRTLTSRVGGVDLKVSVKMTGPIGFVLAKAAAYAGRHADKDLYDIAFVILYNDAGWTGADLGERIFDILDKPLPLTMRKAFIELRAAFADPQKRGPTVWASRWS